VGLFRTQFADRILDAADLLIIVGYDPIEFEPGLWNRGKKRNLVHIDVISSDIDNDYRPQVELIGNIGATVGALVDHINAGASTGGAELLREVPIECNALAEKATALNGTPIHPIRLVHQLQTLLSDDMTLCLDMGTFHIWLAHYLYSFRARQILMTNGQQTLGVGLPWAIAASLIHPSEKVISVSGDGGFLFSAMELETAVRLECNLVHLVWIDGFYDMVGLQEMAKYGRLSGVTLGPVDVVRFAEAFGACGLRIERPDEISSTLKKAIEIEGPVIVGVPVDYRDNHRLMENVHPEALS
jgi:acetolactate synthase-1/2/3 large subunit